MNAVRVECCRFQYPRSFMRRSISRAILTLLAVRSLAACAGEGPTVARPEVPHYVPAPAPPSPPPITALPASGAVAVYDRQTVSVIPGSSRYVIYGEGVFSLEYIRPDWGFFEYRGHYSRADSSIVFSFDGWSIAGSWLATGIVSRDSSIVVKYNVIMQMSDFEDGVYRSAAPLSIQAAPAKPVACCP